MSPLVCVAGSHSLWLQGPGGAGASFGTLACKARSEALWWTGLGPGAAGLLVDGAVSLPR